MEGKKKKASSSSSASSLTSELFGSRENPCPSSSSSSAIFGSIFNPPSKVLGRESVQQQQDKTSKTDVDGNKDVGTVYQDQKVQPCHLSSSIYYGGPDVYFQPQNSSINSTKKKEGEDDSGTASRGNWWQGSLYY